MKKEIIRINNLSYKVKDGDEEKMLLNNISISFEIPEIITISGPSGSGKTTFLYAISGMLDNLKGEIYIEEKNILACTKKEREMLDWLMKAGLHLTVAELVCLNEKGISPTEDLLYSYNRQALTEAIYLDHSIQDNVLEAQMEHSPARDVTVATILSLLRKKRILLL